MSAETSIRPTTAEDTPAVTRVLGDAFRDDPVITYIADRRGLSEAYFRIAFRSVYSRLGHSFLCTDAAGRALGCCLWAGPGQSVQTPPLEALARFFLATLRYGGLSALGRARRLDSLLEPHHPREAHYYLHAIGVHRSAQGTGVGGKLLRHGLAKADRDGLPAFLENSNERNLPFYRRHGFEVTREVTVEPDGPTLWMMFRPPGAGPR